MAWAPVTVKPCHDAHSNSQPQALLNRAPGSAPCGRACERVPIPPVHTRRIAGAAVAGKNRYEFFRLQNILNLMTYQKATMPSLTEIFFPSS